MSPANNPGVRKKQTTTTKIHTYTRFSPYTKKSFKMSLEAWLPPPTLLLTGLSLLLSLGKCRLDPLHAHRGEHPLWPGAPSPHPSPEKPLLSRGCSEPARDAVLQ